MKNSQATAFKGDRLKQVLKLASSHPGFEMATIKTGDNAAFISAIINHLSINLDFIEFSEGEILRVQLAAKIPMPSKASKCNVANQVNMLLCTAKVIIATDGFILEAHQFVEKNCLPEKTNLLHLINEVLVGIKLIVGLRSKLLENMEAEQPSESQTNVCLN